MDAMNDMNYSMENQMNQKVMTMDKGNMGMDMGNMEMDDMGMAMSFYVGTHSTILFKGWTTDSWQTMLGSCLAIFVMAGLYEGLKVFRETLLQHTRTSSRSDMQRVPTSEEAPIVANQKSIRGSMLSMAHLVQTIMHVLQIVISYFLMLIFMTYNVYLCIAVALGAGVGYFLFAWKRAMVVDLNEHCH